MDKLELIAAIDNAFSNVALADGIGLREADAMDSYKDESYKAQCRKKDERHSWNSIPSSQLNQYNSSLSYFDAKGMKFHLPAFMVAEIKGEYRFGMSFVLTNLSAHSKAQFQLLGPQQCSAVKSFLEYLLQHPDYEFEQESIKDAIEKYWAI